MKHKTKKNAGKSPVLKGKSINAACSYPVGVDFDTIQNLISDATESHQIDSPLSVASDDHYLGATSRSQAVRFFNERSERKFRLMVHAFCTPDTPEDREEEICFEVNKLLNWAVDWESIYKLHLRSFPQAMIDDIVCITPDPRIWKEEGMGMLTGMQKGWLIEGMYPQAVFLNWNTSYNAPDVLDHALMAMTVDDMLYAITGNVSPYGQLDSMREDSDDTVAFCLYDYEAMWRKECVWRNDLRIFRNEILVALRAGLDGRKPMDELKRFRAAGCNHFLDYPGLCG